MKVTLNDEGYQFADGKNEFDQEYTRAAASVVTVEWVDNENKKWDGKDFTYTGEKQYVQPVVNVGKDILEAAKGYTLKYYKLKSNGDSLIRDGENISSDDIVNAGPYETELTLNSGYSTSDDTTVRFNINKAGLVVTWKDEKGNAWDDSKNTEYDGEAHYIVPEIKTGKGEALRGGTDYQTNYYSLMAGNIRSNIEKADIISARDYEVEVSLETEYGQNYTFIDDSGEQAEKEIERFTIKKKKESEDSQDVAVDIKPEGNSQVVEEYTEDINKDGSPKVCYSAGSGSTMSVSIPGLESGWTVRYKSEDTSVADVNEDGQVTLKDAGTTTITVEIIDEHGKTIEKQEMYVKSLSEEEEKEIIQYNMKLELDKYACTLDKKDEKIDINATATVTTNGEVPDVDGEVPDAFKTVIKWSIDNDCISEVGSLEAEGEAKITVQAVKNGSSTVTADAIAKIDDNQVLKKSANCIVTVDIKDPTPTPTPNPGGTTNPDEGEKEEIKVSVSPKEGEVLKGNRVNLKATVEPKDAKIEWKLKSEAGVAKLYIDSEDATEAFLETLKEGKVEIEVTASKEGCESASDTSKITIKDEIKSDDSKKDDKNSKDDKDADDDDSDEYETSNSKNKNKANEVCYCNGHEYSTNGSYSNACNCGHECCEANGNSNVDSSVMETGDNMHPAGIMSFLFASIAGIIGMFKRKKKEDQE